MTQSDSQAGSLRKDALGVWSIVFFVLATNGPLTGLVGVVPSAVLMGNGIGLPSVFLIVGVVYLIFAVGFVAMARHIKNAGAFYAYVSSGLGRPLGVAAAFLAIVAYAGMQIACYGLIGFFTSQALHNIGIDLDWWILSIVYAVLVQMCGTRNVEFNGRVLTFLMLAELLVIIIFDAGVIGHKGGPQGFGLASFDPQHVFNAGFGAALVFVGGSFMGFETTAIYAEEAKNPAKTLPRATFAAVTLITLFFAFSSWLFLLALGTDNAVHTIAEGPGAVWFTLSTQLVGRWLADAINVLLITSLFAVILSFHNSLSRYLFSLGRERVLPRVLARTHEKHQMPHVASAIQTACCIILLLIFGAIGIDPIQQVLPLGSAPATMGIVAVQCLASVAVIRYFHRGRRSTSIWQRLIAPGVSALALFMAEVIIITHVSLLTGGQPVLDLAIPLGMLIAALAGVAVAFWHKRRNPEVYANLARVLHEV